jgi:hypothetical protein
MLHFILVLNALAICGVSLLRLYREVHEELHKRRRN